MLYLIPLLFSLSAFSLSDQMRQCMSGVFERAGFDRNEQNRLQVGNGMSAYDRRIRAFVANARPAAYDKHTQARTVEEAAAKSANGGAAQYLPGVRLSVERRALNPATPGVVTEERGKLFKYVEFPTPVGFDSGTATKFMRVELGSAGEFHGHPMSEQRLRRVCPQCIK